jgi:hypothetical protein
MKNKKVSASKNVSGLVFMSQLYRLRNFLEQTLRYYLNIKQVVLIINREKEYPKDQ